MRTAPALLLGAAAILIVGGIMLGIRIEAWMVPTGIMGAGILTGAIAATMLVLERRAVS